MKRHSSKCDARTFLCKSCCNPLFEPSHHIGSGIGNYDIVILELKFIYAAITDIKVNGYTFRGSNSLFSFASHLISGIDLSRKQTGSHNSCFPLKNVTENHGSVLICLKGFLK